MAGQSNLYLEVRAQTAPSSEESSTKISDSTSITKYDDSNPADDDVHRNSPDTVIHDMQSDFSDELDDRGALLAKDGDCLACIVSRKRCPTCVFRDVKSGNEVDLTVLAEAVNSYENMLGAYNMALIKKNVDTHAQHHKISDILRKIFKNLDMLKRITDNTLKYTGNNGISALLHNYRVQFDVLLRNAGEIYNVSQDAIKPIT